MKYLDIEGFDRVRTIGAIEIGNGLSTFLLGVVTLQTFNYFRSFPNDPAYMKLAVGVVYVLDVVHSGLLWKMVYFYTIIGPCDLLALKSLDSSLVAAFFCLGVLMLIVQTFFCQRIYRITGSKILAIGCLVLCLIRFGGGIYATYLAAMSMTQHTMLLKEFRNAMYIVFPAGTSADIAITACIIVSLIKKKTGVWRTDVLLDRIIAYTISSGLLPTIVAATVFITYVALPKTLIWLACWMVMSKVVSNSFLASLNQRNPKRHDNFGWSNTSGLSSVQCSGLSSVHLKSVPPARPSFMFELSQLSHSDGHTEGKSIA